MGEGKKRKAHPILHFARVVRAILLGFKNQLGLDVTIERSRDRGGKKTTAGTENNQTLVFWRSSKYGRRRKEPPVNHRGEKKAELGRRRRGRKELPLPPINRVGATRRGVRNWPFLSIEKTQREKMKKGQTTFLKVDS